METSLDMVAAVYETEFCGTVTLCQFSSKNVLEVAVTVRTTQYTNAKSKMDNLFGTNANRITANQAIKAHTGTCMFTQPLHP